MTKHKFAMYSVMEAEGGLFRACRVAPNTQACTPLPAPFGDPMERRHAVKEASNALYRELCLGILSEPAKLVGLSPDFKITSR